MLNVLGEEVVPVLREEFAALRPEAPMHASLAAARDADAANDHGAVA